MSAPKFSPGEWRAEWLDDLHGWVMNDKGDYLCEIVVDDKEGKFVTPKQQRANAVLMASSPMLIEALKEMGKAADELMAELAGKRGSNWAVINEALMKRTAAIRKAEVVK